RRPRRHRREWYRALERRLGWRRSSLHERPGRPAAASAPQCRGGRRPAGSERSAGDRRNAPESHVLEEAPLPAVCDCSIGAKKRALNYPETGQFICAASEVKKEAPEAPAPLSATWQRRSGVLLQVSQPELGDFGARAGHRVERRRCARLV